MALNNNFWIDTYKQNIKKLIGVCYRYVYDQKIAEDIAHDSFLTAMKRSETFKGKGQFDAWLRKITVNTALQYLREMKKQKASHQEFLYEELNNNDEEMFQKYNFTTKELLEAISELPEHHRYVFNLFVLDGFSHKEIAELLNISAGTSKSHLSRAKKKLRQILNRKEEKRKSFILLLLPFSFEQIDRLYKRKFKNYEISPQNNTFLYTSNWDEVKLPRFIYYSIILKGIIFITVILAIVIVYNYETTDVSNNLEELEFLDSLSIKSDSILVQKTAYSVKQTKLEPKIIPVIIKKKRVIHKKVIVRDTLPIIDTVNVE